MPRDEHGPDEGSAPSGSADVSATLMRRFFSLAAEAARAQHAPADRWDAFVEALWQQVDAGFGLSGDGEEFDDVPMAWFEHPDDPAVVVWEDSEG